MRRLMLALCLLLAAGAGWGQQPARHRVVIEAMRFEPAQLVIQRGDEVEWVNRDPFPHTATAAQRFDTGEIAPGGSKRLRIDTPGALAYFCSLHPTMKAQLQVK